MKRTSRPYSAKTKKNKQPKTANKMVLYKPVNTTNLRMVKRHADHGTVNVNPVTGNLVAMFFALNKVAGYTELTAMYDRYKINAVEVCFYPKVNGIRTTALADTPDPARFLSCIDYNDSFVPTSANSIREYETCEVTVIYEKHTRYVPYPKVVDGISSTRTSYISTANVTEPHYGLKYVIEPTNQTGAGVMVYTVEATYYMTFKDLK